MARKIYSYRKTDIALERTPTAIEKVSLGIEKYVDRLPIIITKDEM